MKRVRERKYSILALFVLLAVMAMWSRSDVGTSNSATYKPTDKSAHKMKSIYADQVASYRSVEKDVEPIDRTIASGANVSTEPCMTQVLKKIEEHCDSSCFLSKLRSRGSDAAEFFNDGWYRPANLVPTAEQRTQAGRFFYALGTSGLLLNDFGISKNETYGAVLFDRLIEEDPENAAYYIFATALALRRGQRKAAHHYQRQMMVNAKKFESYFQSLSRTLFKESLVEPQDYFVAIEMRTQLPLPEYYAVKELILQDRDIDPGPISSWLMSEGLRTQGAFMDSHWSPFEYAVGIALMRVSHPQENFSAPSLKTLFSHLDAYEFDKLLNPDLDQEVCDVDHTLQTQLNLLDTVKRKAFTN
jgi:hypothetical protein